MARRDPAEARLQRAIMVDLGALEGVVVHRNNVGTATYGGARVEYGVGGKGAPDLIVEVMAPSGLWACVWIEVKMPAGRVEPHQVQWHMAARTLNRHAYVVRSVEHAQQIVESFKRGEVFRG